MLEEAVDDQGQVGGPGLEEFAEAKKIDSELQKAVELQHQGLEKATESLEHAMEILNSLPSTDTVIDMIDTSKEEVVSAVDEVTGALKLNLEGVRRDVVRKTAREDVLRLIAKALREAMDRLRPHDDALMIGRAPVRCIACNTVMDSVHDKPAAKVIHGALSAQSATVAGDSRMGSVQEHRANVVIRVRTQLEGPWLLALVVKATPGMPAGAAEPVRQKHLFSLHEGAAPGRRYDHWQVAKPVRERPGTTARTMAAPKRSKRPAFHTVSHWSPLIRGE